MRISSSSFYAAGIARMSDLQQSLMKTQEQLSSGKRILTPADDPIGAARALEITQAQTVNTQYAANRGSARDSLSLEENALQSVTSLIQDVQTLTVNAGNATLDDTQRKTLATNLQGRLDELVGLANTRDGTGNYLFSGYQVTSMPFTQSATGATYAGDQGQRQLQVGTARQLAITDPGSAVFENIRTGNGTFATVANPANTGTGVISPGSVTNLALLTGHNYALNFSVAAGGTTYDIVDTTTALPVSVGNAYTAGQPINFDGMQVTISGSPANGDQFTTTPSTSQSVFTTIRNLITVLNTPVAGPSGNTSLTSGLSTASGELSGALDNILTTRASVGTRLNELDSLDNAGDDRNIQYAKTLADLQDVDYVKAITELTQTQTALEAAQKSFIQISGLSLFKLL